LARKSGSRMKVQERCCQGLSASSASHLPTVEAETASVVPRVMASRASSGQLHTDSGLAALQPLEAMTVAGGQHDLAGTGGGHGKLHWKHWMVRESMPDHDAQGARRPAQAAR